MERWWQGITRSGGYTQTLHLRHNGDFAICGLCRVSGDGPVSAKHCGVCARIAAKDEQPEELVEIGRGRAKSWGYRQRCPWGCRWTYVRPGACHGHRRVCPKRLPEQE